MTRALGTSDGTIGIASHMQGHSIMKRQRVKLAILLLLGVLEGCSRETFDSKITNDDQTFIMSHIMQHPAMMQFPSSQIGAGYDEGDTWRIKIHGRGQKSPAIWFRVEKKTGRTTLIE